MSGVQQGMAFGQYPVVLAAPNLQVKVASVSTKSAGKFELQPPTTASQVASGYIQPNVVLGPGGLSACPSIGKYIQLSMLQWSTSPYANSNLLKSPLVRIDTLSQADIISSNATFTPTLTSRGSRSARYPLYGVPAYTITLQYSNPILFNFSASGKRYATERGSSNFSIPSCSLYNGVQFLPCQGCNISSYTETNVSYTCYDITQICPTVFSRRLSDMDGGSVDLMSSASRGLANGFRGPESRITYSDDDSDDDSYDDGDNEEVSYRSIDDYGRQRYSRSLETADDDGTTGNPAPPAAYGVLLQTIGAEISSVVTSNPFSLKVKESTTILVFMGTLGGVILLMLLCLHRRDQVEKVKKLYVKNESDQIAKRMLDEDIKRGRGGDHGMIYQSHLLRFQRSDREASGPMKFIRKGAAACSPFAKKKKVSDVVTYYSEKVLDCDTDDGSDDSELGYAFDREYTPTATVTEFLHKLFPGLGIFTKKNTFFDVVAENHDYFRMFGGSTMTQPRTIRFLQLVTLVLVALFVDTIFFSIFYPRGTICSVHTNKVRIQNLQFQKLHFSTLHCDNYVQSLFPSSQSDDFLSLASLSFSIRRPVSTIHPQYRLGDLDASGVWSHPPVHSDLLQLTRYSLY